MLYWAKDGRIARVARSFDPGDITFEPNGSLLATQGNVLWRVDAQGGRTRIAGQPGKEGTSGDGGPATLATLVCPQGLDEDGTGAILVADRCARRVRRISPDGLIATVAGDGSKGGRGDGGPATAASLRGPEDVVAIPGGGFAILDGPQNTDPGESIRIVDSNGAITTRAKVHATELAAEPDGAILMVDWTATRGALVARLRADGGIETVAARSERAGIGTYGWCSGECAMQIDSVARAPDGSLLIGGDNAVLYVPSQSPGTLAVALGHPTRFRRRALEAMVRLTRPAHVRVRVRGRRGMASTRELDLPAGDTAVRFPELTRSDVYNVQLSATGDGQLALAEGAAIAGGLSARVARGFVTDFPPRAYYQRNLKVSCRRRGQWRVACGVSRRRRCLAVVTVRVLQTGRVKKSFRVAGRRCR